MWDYKGVLVGHERVDTRKEQGLTSCVFCVMVAGLRGPLASITRRNFIALS
eukprot:m.31477 g.31477  ORF g.31477 m.31477 type:complete len:51 (-) comp13976_c1_seq2:55-207(-)